MDKIYIIITLALLLGFIVFKEIGRKNKSNLIFRIAASILAILSLFFIALPISYDRKVSTGNGNTAVLLTEGYSKDSLAAWKDVSLFSTDKEITEKDKKVNYIPDIAYFLSSNPDFQTIHILGYGLEPDELKSLKTKNLIFHPSALADGISSISWRGKIRSGEQLLVQGRYNNTTETGVKLILQGLGTNLDSVIIGKETWIDFELKCIPKHLDKAIYSLIAIADKDTISREELPVLVKERESLRVLILASSPDFENKFLKNWLSEQGYSVSVRTTISTAKYSTEFLNSRKNDLNRINTTLLNNFDILIGDMSELSRLSSTENQAVQNQINNGMGLIIKADASEPGNGFYRKAFSIRENKKLIPKTIKLIWEDHSAIKTVLQGSNSIEIIAQSGTQSLVKNESGDILTNSKLSGKGRIILTVINDSYTWVLGNNVEDYSSFWSYILEKAARKKENSKSFAINSLPVINKNSGIEFQSENGTIPGIQINEEGIAFKQHPVLRFQQTGSFWPAQSGWQSLQSENTDIDWFYVFDEKSWKGVKASEKLKNTQISIERSEENITTKNGAIQVYEDTIPPIWFYILFLLCCTYLWLEVKLS
ncbi:hypothetical protein SAMN05421813_10211 [Daejeonella rubra]|uniref:Uncharacterized protein n=1 Tax=Daejeonella rubra TaxID=990371 RepID=A0A1G9MLV7_9SPHI|nr:hypothetical protein [Daejeonella rubra]SDL74635.1 hypothetical protein SAMN05421813_10211 [Daejeonella rubra]